MTDTALKDRKDAEAVTELKQQLVDCIRMLEQSDIIDYNGHASIRARRRTACSSTSGRASAAASRSRTSARSTSKAT